MLSSLFVDRPRFAIVIAIVTTIAGLLALFSIPIAQYPDIVPPQVSVSTSYPGASGAVVDATIAQPIEAQVVGVDKMIYMKSVSGDDGSYALTASFELGTDPDINTVNVNNRVQVALSSLPQDVQRQGVTVKKRSSALLAVIALYSPKHTHDPLFISNYVTINLLDQVKSTAGVGDAALWGPQDYAMRAWVRTDRLTGLGLTTGDIVNAIKAQNVQAAVGRIGARPISDEQQLQLNIQTQGRLSSADEFANIVVRTNPDGSVLRLRDVARVELGAANLDRETRLNGGPAAVVAIYQSPGANAIATLQAVRSRFAELEKRFPEDLAWKVTYDPTSFVTATIHEVQKTLVEAFILVVLVVFLFLGSVRATLIPTFAVPVSLIGTFVVLKAVGYSANSVSLLAIVLAIGIVVDDAIVVVENVERVMEEHPELSPAEATKRAMREITAPIIAITLVLLSVFVPVAFIPGISGELFRQFAVTVAVAMFLSAINALTLSPALCAVLLRPHHGPRRGLIGGVMRSIDRVRDAYGSVVARIVRFSVIGLVMVAVAGFGVVGLSNSSGLAVGIDRRSRLLCRHGHRTPDPRSLCADRNGGADRTRREKRHTDRRVRQGEAGPGRAASRGSHGGCTSALPAGHDDVVRLHSGPLAAGRGRRRLTACAARRRHAGVRRHDPRVVHRDFRHPAALCRLPGGSGEAETVRSAEGALEISRA
jgi:hydrophobe/amphiphile efflux-1 (HAE1) family protein